MALAGRAFLARAGDVVPQREAEYDQWHTLEHVPERVSARGFHGARRYVNRAREQHRYFTLYDVDSLDVFESDEYRDLRDHPTPWSAAMRPDFGNVVRATCSVQTSRGVGIGAAIGCLCVDATGPADLLDAALEATHAGPRVNAVHVGKRSDDASTVPFAPRLKGIPARAFDRIVLIEALDRDAARDALTHAKHALGLDSLPVDFGADVYDLAFAFPGAGDGERRAHRRPAWDSR